MTRPPRFASLDDWLGWLQTLHPKQIDMSLGRVNGVLDRLGLRPPPYRVITVAGTNGKGSCVALLEQIYLEAGYRVGAFTSPHLVRFNERIRFGGRDLDDAELIELFEIMDDRRGELTLSYFEASAVAAMLGFARLEADVAVLEVGMGGRLDATNALDADAALIVSIDLDHMEYLGPTRDIIGREKAGIVRDGRPAIVADRDPPAGLIDEIAQRGGRLLLIDRDFAAEPEGAGLSYWRADSPPRSFPRPIFGGRIQLGNAAAVIATVEAMQPALPVTDAAIAAGLGKASLKGRFERIRVDDSEWIFDVAHNPASAALLHEALTGESGESGEAEKRGSEPGGKPPGSDPLFSGTIAVFGAMRDKDLARVVAPFIPLVGHWHVGGVDSDRGASPAALAALLRELGAAAVTEHETIEAATAAARAARAARVLAFGSFYVVGPAMKAIGIY